MKKLLVLSLVLGIASLATAGLSLTKTSDTTATLSSTDTLAYNAYVIVEQTGAAYSIDFTAGGNPNGDSTVGAVEDYGDGYDWRFLTVASFNALNPLEAGNQAVITLLDAGTLTQVQLYDSTGYVALSDVITLGIPEPATMALLGLGALVLRRRK